MSYNIKPIMVGIPTTILKLICIVMCDKYKKSMCALFNIYIL